MLLEGIADLARRQPENACRLRLHPARLFHGLDQRVPAHLRHSAIGFCAAVAVDGNAVSMTAMAIVRRLRLTCNGSWRRGGRLHGTDRLCSGLVMRVFRGPLPKDRRQAKIMLAREVIGVDPRALCHGGGAVDAVFKFADVSREVALAEHLERIGCEVQIASVLLAELVQKIPGKLGDVARSVPERRQEERHHIDAVVKVGAELLLGNEFFQIPVRGADETEVNLQGLLAADALELAFLQDAQQLRLKGVADLADLVQEDCSAMGKLEAALPCRNGAGKGTLLMSEQLGLDDAFR